MLLTYRKCFVLHRGMESNKSEKLTCTPVKCTYCLKDTALQQYINKYNSCLKSENGDASLKREHAYYYQTQRQIFTAGKLYCDFVVCGFREQIDLFCGNMHKPSMPHFYFSSKWFCPLVPKNTSAKNEKSKCKQTRDILDEALKLDFSCTCKQKPLCLDKLLKCHNPSCQSGKFFHLPCLNFKQMPNNAMTTW